MTCRFCGASVEADDLLHVLRCDGRQGQVEALAPFAPHQAARTTDPETSHAAARTADITEVQRRVLAIHVEYRESGLNDGQLYEIYCQRYGKTPESSPRKRRHDLTQAGLLVDSGERRQFENRARIVWKFNSQGRTLGQSHTG